MQLLVSKSGVKTKETPQYQQGLVDYIKPSLKPRPVSQHNVYSHTKHRNINVSLNDLNKTTSVFVTPQLDISQVPQPRLTNSWIFSMSQQKKSQNRHQKVKQSFLRFTGSQFIENINIEDKLFNSLNLGISNSNLQQQNQINLGDSVTQKQDQLESSKANKEELQQMYNDDSAIRDLAEQLIEQQADNLPAYPKQWMIQETKNMIQENIREIQPKSDEGKKYILQFCRESAFEHDINYNKANKLCGKSQLLQNQYKINQERFKINYDLE